MATQRLSKKRLQIDKANSRMVVAVAVAGFLIVFSIFASRALWSQRGYQVRVIEGKEKAVDQLDKNIKSVDKLATSYQTFINTPDNVIGGNPNGTGDKDGNNAKIVLDALPSKYDFPALITSVEKLLRMRNFELKSIGGKDDEAAQNSASGSSTSDKQSSSSKTSTSQSKTSKTKTQAKKTNEPIEMPFKFSSDVGDFGRVRELLELTELSIRPIVVKKLTISGADKGTNVTLQVDAVSYYQPAKGLTIEKKVMQ